MFTNEALSDFSVTQNEQALRRELHLFQSRLEKEPFQVRPIVDGKELDSTEVFKHFDPSEFKTCIAQNHFAAPEVLKLAEESLSQGLKEWRNLEPGERSSIIRKAAELLRQKRHELNAIIIREVGKPWLEADADVAEAIDFCEYYAAQLPRFAPQKTAQPADEENTYLYQPRGMVAVIAPWNFPLAIACGMTVAALITGNVVILKPAEQSGLTGYSLTKILLAAGVPPNAIAFLPGRGETIGRALVISDRINLVCFTGSKQVGLEIIARCGETRPGQQSIKRVIAEMGGKNAIIVDENADLEAALKGVLKSAFGYAGQKCSACSRLIVVGKGYRAFISRLCEEAAKLKVGPAQEPRTDFGPVINQESMQRIMSVASQAEKDCHLAFRGTAAKGGYFVPVHIFRDVPPSHFIWREEIFGPILACRQVSDFTEALTLANDSQYALTGGLYSRSKEHIETAKRHFKVGNLYINRHCTGAMVGRQPFGGFRLSGIGFKAGGPDYLLQFMEPRVITENKAL